MKSIRPIMVLATAAATMLTAAPNADAQDPTIVAGRRCSFTPTGPSGEGTVVGSIDAGPIYGGSQGRPVTSVYLLCSLQIGPSTTHGATNVYEVSTWTIGVAAIPPGTVAFTAPPGQQIHLCSEIWIDTNDGHITLVFAATSGTWIPFDGNARCETLPAHT